MKVETLITGISHVVSAQGSSAKHGSAMSDLIRIEDAAIGIDNGLFSWLGKAEDWRGHAASVVNLGGRAMVRPHGVARPVRAGPRGPGRRPGTASRPGRPAGNGQHDN